MQKEDVRAERGELEAGDESEASPPVAISSCGIPPHLRSLRDVSEFAALQTVHARCQLHCRSTPERRRRRFEISIDKDQAPTSIVAESPDLASSSTTSSFSQSSWPADRPCRVAEP